MLDVTAFGALGDGQTDDSAAIKSALQAALAKSEEVYFPPGTYALHTSAIDQSVIELSLGHVPLRLRGEPGSVLRAFSSSGQRGLALFELAAAGGGLSIRGLRFSGAGLVSQLVWLRNETTTGLMPGDVLVEDCSFETCLQRDQSLFAAGLFVHGAFDTVRIRDCDFRRMRTDKPGGDARGAAVTSQDDATVVRPRTALISGCSFEHISSSDGLDADGLAVQLNQQVPLPDGSTAPGPHPMSSAVVQGCRFIDCQTRSIKLQTERASVVGNSFLRRSFQGRIEVDAQYSGIVASSNLFRYIGWGCQTAVVVATVRHPNQSDCIISGNIVHFEGVVGNSVFASMAEPTGDQPRVVITDNVVHGKTSKLLYFRKPGADQGAVPSVRGNIVEDCNHFLWAEASEPQGVIRGDFAFNRISAGPRPVALLQDGVAFVPDNWVANTNITS